jgi:hypothetical protein
MGQPPRLRHGTGRGGEAAVERDSEDFTDQGFFSLGNGCLLSFHLCELVLDSLLPWPMCPLYAWGLIGPGDRRRISRWRSENPQGAKPGQAKSGGLRVDEARKGDAPPTRPEPRSILVG